MKRTRGESPNTNGSGFLFADAGASPKEAAPEVEEPVKKKRPVRKTSIEPTDSQKLGNETPESPTTDKTNSAVSESSVSIFSSTAESRALAADVPGATNEGSVAPPDANAAESQTQIEPEAVRARERAIPEKLSEEPRVERSKPSAYQVVARRYRPQTFDELIGQETVARALSNAIETDRVGHAYLFTGARGVGKTSCARIFAKSLNCVDGPTTRPCLQCDSCVAIASGDDVDVIEIDGASNRGVDEIRQLRQNAAIAPSRSLYKIYIIDEVHMLTREAFNALLKTLEEPPARVKFIFCTTEPNKIPITILSRCQRFDFGNVNGASIAARLGQIARQEGAEAEEGVFDVLARRANGSMRDAQSLLEQLLSFAPKHISLSDVHQMLGSVDDKVMFDLLGATVRGDAAEAFRLLDEASKRGVDFGVLIEQTIGIYRDLMVVGCGCGANELLYSPIARLDELRATSEELGIRRILAALQILDQTAQRARVSPQSRVLTELAFARLCRLDAFQAIETLIAQLRQGAFPNISASFVSNSARSESSEQKKNPDVESQLATPSSPLEAPVENRAPASNQSASPSNVGWISLPQETLIKYWLESTKSGVVLPSKAATFGEIRAEYPDRFVVLFPEGRDEEKSYCESEKSKIAPKLSKKLGGAVTISCLIDPSVSPRLQTNDVSSVQTPSPSAAISARPNSGFSPVASRANDPRDRRSSPRGDFQEIRREFEQNPTVQEIKELFDAELGEIKPPATGARSFGRSQQ
ncbi:MAG: DNA polymerase III subunit gamma/tau [Thermoguttaceae bacterium]|nr:DNA polymerase III subunit gamma/tau [Thermoguttaceae bacterium]